MAPDDSPPQAGKLPTGRLARTARVGELVTGQGLRWAGMRTANRLRTPERAGDYLPAGRADAVDAEWALRLMRMAIGWYARPGMRRFSSEDARGERHRERPDDERRAAGKAQVNQFTLPPESILIRRMHGIVAIVLTQLRAGADWGAIAAEYLHGGAPATALGRAEAEFLAGNGETVGVG